MQSVIFIHKLSLQLLVILNKAEESVATLLPLFFDMGPVVFTQQYNPECFRVMDFPGKLRQTGNCEGILLCTCQ